MKEDVGQKPGSLKNLEQEEDDSSEKLKLFRERLIYLERIETRKATDKICEETGHDEIYCTCMEKENDDPELFPKKPLELEMIQPDGSLPVLSENGSRYLVASIFVKNSKFKKSVPNTKKNHGRRKQSAEQAAMETEKLIKRRELKKKLFMDLGIVRTKSGFADPQGNREAEMKRRVTETIVTTFCSPCEQNFSSSKMLLMHNEKVHNTKFLECHLCTDRFEQTILFNRHMKTHYGPNALSFVKCEFCERTFKDRESLTTHLNVTHKRETAEIVS